MAEGAAKRADLRREFWLSLSSAGSAHAAADITHFSNPKYTSNVISDHYIEYHIHLFLFQHDSNCLASHPDGIAAMDEAWNTAVVRKTKTGCTACMQVALPASISPVKQADNCIESSERHMRSLQSHISLSPLTLLLGALACHAILRIPIVGEVSATNGVSTSHLRTCKHSARGANGRRLISSSWRCVALLSDGTNSS